MSLLSIAWGDHVSPDVLDLPDNAIRDNELMLRLQMGEAEALSDLYRAYSHLVFRIAMRVLNDPHDAEDVLQEIFLRLWRRPLDYNPEKGKLTSWLAVVTRNRAIDFLRVRRFMDCADELPLAAPQDVAKDTEISLTIHRVASLVEALPSRQRVALEMAFVEEMTHTQIAASLQAPLGTVKTNIRTALGSLRLALSNKADAASPDE